MIGLKRGVVELYEHDILWEENAQETIRKLEAIFGAVAADIQHVGSTSIVHIKAKPIIDIAVAVNSFDDVMALVPKLEANGFIYRQHDVANDMLFVCGDMDTDIRTHHIHVVKDAGKEWRDYIAFRDYLNACHDIAEQYETVKLELVGRYKNDRLAYTDAKAKFIQSTLRKARAYEILGQTVTVTVDRPLGSVHPEHKELVYSVNYGYVGGVMGGDGEEQDAYILGVNEPVGEFTGKVIGVILRENDNEDKWVVAPKDCIFNQAEIMSAVMFQEQYFKTSLICLYEKSCGVIVYRKAQQNAEYLLLLQRESQTWSFPKGHAEPYESEKQTACREVFEETGLTVNIKDSFRESVAYPVNKKATKYVSLFLAELSGNIEVRQDEVEKYKWADKDCAARILPNVGYADILEKVEKSVTV